MATAKKKYRPGKIVAKPPVLVNSFTLFGPFEAALKRVIETGEAEVDQFGVTIYRGADGRPMSYWHSLQLYIRLIQFQTEKLGLTFDTKPLCKVREQLSELKILDEEDVEITLQSLVLAQRIIASIPFSQLREWNAVIRKEFAERQLPYVKREFV